MGLNCGCPLGAHLADLTIEECKESMGQLQKVFFQRRYKTAGTLNTVEDPTKKASWTTLLSAADGSKVTVSPYIQNPSTEPGAARTFGSGNQVLGGIPIVLGREATSFTGTIYQENQKVIAQMKDYQCEDIAVWLVDENGNIGCLVDDLDDPTNYYPIPIQSFFVGDKTLGGYEEPDSNAISWSFIPNWSDKFVILSRSSLDFNPLTDIVNTASAGE